MSVAVQISYDHSLEPAPNRQKSASDEVFQIAYFLADFAHDHGMKEVSLKLEDVLDAVLEHEKRISTTKIPRLASSTQVSPRLKEIMAGVISRQRAAEATNDT